MLGKAGGREREREREREKQRTKTTKERNKAIVLAEMLSILSG
jgi:hypothetical protein